MIDVSQFQGSIVWSRVTHNEALIRVTMGSAGTDPFGQANLRGAHSTGKRFGGYHFLEDSDPKSQIAHFLTQWHPMVGGLRGMIDVEKSAFSHPSFVLVTGAVQAYLAETGHYPIIYGNKDDLAGLNLPPVFVKCPLMLANFGPNDGVEHPLSPGDIPAPWKSVAIHQYTSKGQVPGITANTCDLDLVLAPAAVLVPRPRPVIDKWKVSYIKRKGGRHRIFTRTPTLWQERHRRAKYRGAIHIYPHRKET